MPESKPPKRGELLLPPAIVRGRFDQLTLYEVQDRELEILVRGSPASTFLTFAIALASICGSFLVALLTTNIPSDRTFIVFVVVTCISGIASLVLFVLWYRDNRSVSLLVHEIRSRIPPRGIPVSDDAID